MLRRAAWIAADLTLEALGRRAGLGMALFLALWLPFQSGLIDGLAPRGGIWPGLGFRATITMNAAWPVLALLGPVAEVIVGRRQARGMEPLLALPITRRDLVLGASLPAIAGGWASSLTTLGSNAIAYRLASGAWPAAPAAQLCFVFLATQAAALWLSAFMIPAALASRGVSSFMFRASLAYLSLSLLDAPLLAARVAGHASWTPVILLAESAAGAALLLGAGRRLDRARIAGV